MLKDGTRVDIYDVNNQVGQYGKRVRDWGRSANAKNNVRPNLVRKDQTLGVRTLTSFIAAEDTLASLLETV